MNNRFFLVWLFVVVPFNVGIHILVSRSFGRRTGWTALKRLYRESRSYEYGWQTVTCGKGAFPFYWKRSISVGLDPDGLALRSTSPFLGDFPPMFVPWEEIEDIRPEATWLEFPTAAMTFLNVKTTVVFRGAAAKGIITAWNFWNDGQSIPTPVLPPRSDPESW